MSNKSKKNPINIKDNDNNSTKKSNDKHTELNTINIMSSLDLNQKNKKININNNSVLKKIIMKVKDELAKEEIKNEINNIVHPLYEDIYNKIFPHYFTLVILLIVIALLLILIIVINVVNFKDSK